MGLSTTYTKVETDFLLQQIDKKVVGGYKGDLKISDSAPTGIGYYILLETGVYTNLGGINAPIGKLNFASFDGTTWSKVEVAVQNGKSAYEVAVANGFVGTEAQWLASLKPAELQSQLDSFSTLNPELVTTKTVGYYYGGSNTTLGSGPTFTAANLITVKVGDVLFIRGMSAATLALSFQGKLFNSSNNVVKKLVASDFVSVDGGHKLTISTAGSIQLGLHFVNADAAAFSVIRGDELSDIYLRTLLLENDAKIKALLSESVRLINADYIFKGFVDALTATPTPTLNDAYISIDEGSILGLAGVKKGNIIAGNGTGFELHKYNLLKESTNLINLANPATFNYNQYLDTTGYKPTQYSTRCTAPIDVVPGDKICAQGLGYSDSQLATSSVRIGGYFDANMNLLQILRMKTGLDADAVDSIYLNATVAGGAFIDTVPNIPGIKYFVANFVSSVNPTTNKIMVEKSSTVNTYMQYGSFYNTIIDEYLLDYVKKTQLSDYLKISEVGDTFLETSDFIDTSSRLLKSGKIADNDLISFYDKGAAPKNYTTKKVGIIVAGQSNTEGRVPTANFPISFVDELSNTVNYFNGSNKIDLSKYIKNSVSGVFGEYTLPAKWAYDAIVLKRLCHHLNDNVYMINYSKGGTAISTKGTDGGGFWTPRFNEIDQYNIEKPDNNSKMTALFEQAIRMAQSGVDGANYEIKAFLWHQGEGDSLALAASEYYRNFMEVISYVRGVVGNPILPVIFGTISHLSAQYNATVEAAMMKIAADDPYVWMVDMSAGTLLDAYHFDALSTEYLGTEMYKIIRDNIL